MPRGPSRLLKSYFLVDIFKASGIVSHDWLHLSMNFFFFVWFLFKLIFLVKQTFTLIIKYYDKKHTKRFSSSFFFHFFYFCCCCSSCPIAFFLLFLLLLFYFYKQHTFDEKFIEMAKIVISDSIQAKKSLFLTLGTLIDDVQCFKREEKSMAI